MISRLNDLLAEFDGVLLTSPHNMRYFSGFSGGEGAALITSNERFLFTDSRYTEQAQNESAEQGFVVVETNTPLSVAGDKISDIGMKNVLFEDEVMSVSIHTALCKKLGKGELVPASRKINELRMIKTDDELRKMAKAEQIACDAFERILGFIKPGITEREIALELEYFMRKNGAGGIAFQTIAISGKKTSLPHGVPSDKKIENGDFVTMDFGALYDGYCSDMTRTIVVGRASEEQRKVYEVVKDAQARGLEAIFEGAESSKADFAARYIIDNAGYGKYFGHSLGHGVGLLIHELPNLSPRSSFVLKENMIVTCEPGIYIPDFGGVRIEDMVCVKKGGIINLTHASKDLIEL